MHVYIYFHLSLSLFVTHFSNSEKLALIILNIFTYLVSFSVTPFSHLLSLPPFSQADTFLTWGLTHHKDLPANPSLGLPLQVEVFLTPPIPLKAHLQAEPYTPVYTPSSPHSGCLQVRTASWLYRALTPHAKPSSATDPSSPILIPWVTKIPLLHSDAGYTLLCHV